MPGNRQAFFFAWRKKSTSLFYAMLSCVDLCNYDFGCESIFHCYILLHTTHISHISHTSLYFIHPIHHTTKKQFFPIVCKKMIPAISHRIFSQCSYTPFSSRSFLISITKLKQGVKSYLQGRYTLKVYI